MAVRKNLLSETTYPPYVFWCCFFSPSGSFWENLSDKACLWFVRCAFFIPCSWIALQRLYWTIVQQVLLCRCGGGSEKKDGRECVSAVHLFSCRRARVCAPPFMCTHRLGRMLLLFLGLLSIIVIPQIKRWNEAPSFTIPNYRSPIRCLKRCTPATSTWF